MADENSEAIVVLMTASRGEEAARLADLLVVARLAACVQILPEMESVYWWEGKVERAAEILLLAKTTREKFPELEQAVRALHSYQTPEIIALPVAAASTPYLEWLIQTVRPQRTAQNETETEGAHTEESAGARGNAKT